MREAKGAIIIYIASTNFSNIRAPMNAEGETHTAVFGFLLADPALEFFISIQLAFIECYKYYFEIYRVSMFTCTCT